jgi:hypothetical protein
MTPAQLADDEISILMESFADLDGMIATKIIVTRLLLVIDHHVLWGGLRRGFLGRSLLVVEFDLWRLTGRRVKFEL